MDNSTEEKKKNNKLGIRVPVSDYFDWTKAERYLTRDLLSSPMEAAQHANEFNSNSRSYKTPQEIKDMIASIEEKCFYSQEFFQHLNVVQNQYWAFPGQILQSEHVKDKTRFIKTFYEFFEKKDGKGAFNALSLPIFARLELALKSATQISGVETQRKSSSGRYLIKPLKFPQVLEYIKNNYAALLSDGAFSSLQELSINNHEDFINILNLSAQYIKEQKETAKEKDKAIDYEHETFLSLYAKEHLKENIDLKLDSQFIYDFIQGEHYGHKREDMEFKTDALFTYFLDKNLMETKNVEDFCLELIQASIEKDRGDTSSYKGIGKEDNALSIDYIVELIKNNLSQEKTQGIFNTIINNFKSMQEQEFNDDLKAIKIEKMAEYKAARPKREGVSLDDKLNESLEKQKKHSKEEFEKRELLNRQKQKYTKEMALIDSILHYFLMKFPEKLGYDFVFNMMRANVDHFRAMTAREFLILSDSVEYLEGFLLNPGKGWGNGDLSAMISDFKDRIGLIENPKIIDKILRIAAINGSHALAVIKDYPQKWYGDEKEYIRNYGHLFLKTESDLKSFMKNHKEVMLELLSDKSYIESIIKTKSNSAIFLYAGQKYKKIGMDLDLNLAFVESLSVESRHSWDMAEYMNNSKFCAVVPENLPKICAQNLSSVKYLDWVILSNKTVMMNILSELDKIYDPVEILSHFSQSSEYRVKALFTKIETSYNEHNRLMQEAIQQDINAGGNGENVNNLKKFLIAPAFEKTTKDIVVVKAKTPTP